MDWFPTIEMVALKVANLSFIAWPRQGKIAVSELQREAAFCGKEDLQTIKQPL